VVTVLLTRSALLLAGCNTWWFSTEDRHAGTVNTSYLIGLDQARVTMAKEDNRVLFHVEDQVVLSP
jgi:hypothetical protein